MEDYLAALELRNRHQTARGARMVLSFFSTWLAREGADPLAITTEQLRAYQAYVATVQRTATGELLRPSTQGLRLRTLKAYYRWLEARGVIVADPARRLHQREVRSRVVVREYLSLQEATALLQTQARHMLPSTRSHRWACRGAEPGFMIAIGPGDRSRRISGIIGFRVADIDLEPPRDAGGAREGAEWGGCGASRGVGHRGAAPLVIRRQQARSVLIEGPAVACMLFVGRDGTGPTNAGTRCGRLWS